LESSLLRWKRELSSAFVKNIQHCGTKSIELLSPQMSCLALVPLNGCSITELQLIALMFPEINHVRDFGGASIASSSSQN